MKVESFAGHGLFFGRLFSVCPLGRKWFSGANRPVRWMPREGMLRRYVPVRTKRAAIGPQRAISHDQSIQSPLSVYHVLQRWCWTVVYLCTHRVAGVNYLRRTARRFARKSGSQKTTTTGFPHPTESPMVSSFSAATH